MHSSQLKVFQGCLRSFSWSGRVSVTSCLPRINGVVVIVDFLYIYSYVSAIGFVAYLVFITLSNTYHYPMQLF